MKRKLKSPKQISQFKRYQAKGTIMAFRTRLCQLARDDEFTDREKMYFSFTSAWCTRILDTWEKEKKR